jgi:hypothetical protein
VTAAVIRDWRLIEEEFDLPTHRVTERTALRRGG